jgi:hypothetical protein
VGLPFEAMAHKAIRFLSLTLFLALASMEQVPSWGATLTPDPAENTAGPGEYPAYRIVENAGQFNPAVRFQIQTAHSLLWVTDRSLWLTVLSPPAATYRTPADSGRLEALLSGTRGVNIQLTFAGQAKGARLVPTDPRATRMNYILGSDPNRWRSGVRIWGGLTWRGLYPGLSLRLVEVGGEMGLVAEAASGADLSSLRLRVRGATYLRTAHGRPIAETAIGSVPLPIVLHGGQQMRAHPRGGQISFTEGSSSDEMARINQEEGPTAQASLRYGTFLGGAADDSTNGVAVGPDGSKYVAGWTNSLDFPTTPGAFDTTKDHLDAYVSRIDPSGSDLTYSTFLGGRSTDNVLSLAVGPDGTAYVGGSTSSEDFPTTPGAYDTTYNSSDSFITRLDPSGGGLVYSTFLGGADSGEDVRALELAGDGTVYVTGTTSSADFPTTPGAFDAVINDNGVGTYQDAFVTALNPAGTDLVLSTFLGGMFNDLGYGIAVGSDGSAFVTGETSSPDFPVTPGAFDPTQHAMYVTRVNADGTGLAYSTYLGGSELDIGWDIAVDATGTAYVTGQAYSADFPTTPGAYDRSPNGGSDAFVAKLNPSGSALTFGTFLGGGEADVARDLVIDPDGAVILTGDTESGSFPTTRRAFDRRRSGYTDAFVTRFDPAGSRLTYSTFLGGGDLEFGVSIAAGRPGSVSVSGLTSSAHFPTTPGAYDRTYNGRYDVFVATLRVLRPRT